MKKKREIHALDYAIVELISSLDRLFRFAINPLELKVAGGLDVKTDLSRLEQLREVRVWIRPVSWPSTSHVYARFGLNGESCWKAFEGMLIARHLPREFSEFGFRCSWNLDGYYWFCGSSTDDDVLLKQLLVARAATETKQT